MRTSSCIAAGSNINMDSITQYLVIIPALPLASAILTAVLGPRLLKQRSHLLTIGAFAAAFICSLFLVRAVQTAQSLEPSTEGFERIVTLWTWADLPNVYQLTETRPGTPSSATSRPFQIHIALRADGLTSMMLAMVTGVATLVAIFAAGYMHGDRGYW